MITFLPCADFARCAAILDDKRLGGQRTEAWAILKWLRDPEKMATFSKNAYAQAQPTRCLNPKT